MKAIIWDGHDGYVVTDQEDDPESFGFLVDVRRGVASPKLRLGSIVAMSQASWTHDEGPDAAKAIALVSS